LELGLPWFPCCRALRTDSIFSFGFASGVLIFYLLFYFSTFFLIAFGGVIAGRSGDFIVSLLVARAVIMISMKSVKQCSINFVVSAS